MTTKVFFIQYLTSHMATDTLQNPAKNAYGINRNAKFELGLPIQHQYLISKMLFWLNEHTPKSCGKAFYKSGGC